MIDDRCGCVDTRELPSAGICMEKAPTSSSVGTSERNINLEASIVVAERERENNLI